MRAPLDSSSWYGTVSLDAQGILARLQRDFPADSRIAVSRTVGTWSHQLSIETVERIELVSEQHITIITDRYISGASDSDRVSFSYDYRGCMCTINKTNSSGEPIEWILAAIDEVTP